MDSALGRFPTSKLKLASPVNREQLHAKASRPTALDFSSPVRPKTNPPDKACSASSRGNCAGRHQRTKDSCLYSRHRASLVRSSVPVAASLFAASHHHISCFRIPALSHNRGCHQGSDSQGDSMSPRWPFNPHCSPTRMWLTGSCSHSPSTTPSPSSKAEIHEFLRHLQQRRRLR